MVPTVWSCRISVAICQHWNVPLTYLSVRERIGLSWREKHGAYLLEHLAILIVTEIIRSKPSVGQCLGQIDRFFYSSLTETQNQEGLQRWPCVRIVPLFAGIVHGSWRATCDQTSVSFSYLFPTRLTVAAILIREGQPKPGDRKSMGEVIQRENES